MSIATFASATSEIHIDRRSAMAQRPGSLRACGFGATMPEHELRITGPAENQEPWLPDLRAKMASVRLLPAGWDGPNSVAVDRGLLALAERVLRDGLVGIANPRLPFVVPTADGCVQMEWHRRGLDVEVFFGHDGEISTLVDDNGTAVEVEKMGAEALSLFFRWAPRVAAEDSDGVDVQAQAPSPELELAA